MSTFATIFNMSGVKKATACKDLDEMEIKLGTAEVTKLMNCDGNFTAAYKIARGLCHNDANAGDSSPDGTSSTSGHTCKFNICSVAKAQVLFMCVYGMLANI